MLGPDPASDASSSSTYQAPDYSSNYSSSFSSPLAMPVSSPLAAADLSSEPAAVTRNQGALARARASNASASPAISSCGNAV